MEESIQENALFHRLVLQIAPAGIENAEARGKAGNEKIVKTRQ